MRDLIDINRIIMIGEVTAVYPDKAKARVHFPDREDLSSKELPLLFTRALGCEVYAMPEVGEEVLCTFLPNGREEGFILGGYYNGKNPPTADDKETYMIKFPDGNSVTYKNGDFSFVGNVNVTGVVTAPTFVGYLQGDISGTCSGAHE